MAFVVAILFFLMSWICLNKSSKAAPKHRVLVIATGAALIALEVILLARKY